MPPIPVARFLPSWIVHPNDKSSYLTATTSPSITTTSSSSITSSASESTPTRNKISNIQGHWNFTKHSIAKHNLNPEAEARKIDLPFLVESTTVEVPDDFQFAGSTIQARDPLPETEARKVPLMLFSEPTTVEIPNDWQPPPVRREIEAGYLSSELAAQSMKFEPRVYSKKMERVDDTLHEVNESRIPLHAPKPQLVVPIKWGKKNNTSHWEGRLVVFNATNGLSRHIGNTTRLRHGPVVSLPGQERHKIEPHEARFVIPSREPRLRKIDSTVPFEPIPFDVTNGIGTHIHNNTGHRHGLVPRDGSISTLNTTTANITETEPNFEPLILPSPPKDTQLTFPFAPHNHKANSALPILLDPDTHNSFIPVNQQSVGLISAKHRDDTAAIVSAGIITGLIVLVFVILGVKKGESWIGRRKGKKESESEGDIELQRIEIL